MLRLPRRISLCRPDPRVHQVRINRSGADRSVPTAESEGETMIENRSAPGAMIANLCYEDLEKAITWLCDTFGFTERFRYGSPDEVHGAQLRLGDATVMLFGPRIGHGAAENFVFRAPRENAGSHSISIRVEDVDSHHARASELGARILLPPETYQFGERQYSVEDLGRHLWTFSQSVADVAPEAWGASTP
jgi:uncharacterized glyoxalase superfamily protein PhnB